MSDTILKYIAALEIGHSFRSNITGKTIIRTPHGFVVFDRGIHLDHDDLNEAMALIETSPAPRAARADDAATMSGNTSAPTEIRLHNAIARYNAILKERDELARRLEFLTHEVERLQK